MYLKFVIFHIKKQPFYNFIRNKQLISCLKPSKLKKKLKNYFYNREKEKWGIKLNFYEVCLKCIYLENWLWGLDVNWQLTRGSSYDAWTDSLTGLIHWQWDATEQADSSYSVYFGKTLHHPHVPAWLLISGLAF